MKIKSQLIILIFIIVFSFLLIYFFNFLYLNQITNYNNLKNTGNESIQYLYKINLSCKDLLYTNYLDRALEKWKDNNLKGQEIISNFLNSKYLKKLVKRNKEISNYYELTTFIWENVKKDLSKVPVQIDNYFKDNLQNSKGISYIMSENTGNLEIFELFALVTRAGQNLEGTILDDFGNLLLNVNNEINRTEKIYNILILSLSIIIIIVMLVLFLKFLNKLHFKFNSIQDIMKSVSERDFNINIDIKGNDEFGVLAKYISESLNKLKDIFAKIKGVSFTTNNLSDTVTTELTGSKDSLTEITGNIKSIKNEFENFNNNIKASSTSTGEIQTNLNSLKDQIQTQSTTVIQSSSSIEEIITSINNIAGVTAARKESAMQLLDIIKKGDKEINETNIFVQEINKNTQNIQEILNIINGISVQINLLSMNAAIESAHAGEAGKGFSVVAEEIRKLAESTNENSKSIEQYIEHIISLINNTTSISNKNIQSYKLIIGEVNKFVELFEEISSGLEQMSISSKEILEVNKILNNITIDVKSRYNSIIDENQEIDAAIINLNNISSAIFKGISDIYSYIEVIMNKTNSILLKQNDSRENMKNINEELLKFIT